jgi:hypothetical protein
MNAIEIGLQIAELVFSGLVLVSIWLAYRDWKSKQNFDRRNLATGYSLTKNKDYFESRGRTEKRLKKWFDARIAVPAETILRMIEEDPKDELANDIRIVLAHWEVMGISIIDEIIDNKTSFEIVGKTLVTTVAVLREYIDEVRKNEGKERRYDYLLILFDDWSKNLKEAESRGPISRYVQFCETGKDIEKFKRHLHEDKALIDGHRRFIRWFKT